MLLTLVSRPDPASVNIRDRLLEAAEWEQVAEFRGLPVRRHGALPLLMAETEDTHIYAEGVDQAIREEAGVDFAAIVVASKHAAASGHPSLTVHPIGNPGPEAKYGGDAATLVPAPPRLMARALRLIAAEAQALKHDASFEVTHHGPRLETPTMFLEIGSKEGDWGEPAAGEAMARVVLALARDGPAPEEEGPALIGVGGGHYAPRHTDLVRRRRCAVGHLIPNYVLKEGVDAGVLRQAVEGTPGCAGYHVDDKGGVPNLKAVEAALHELGLERVAPDDLEPL